MLSELGIQPRQALRYALLPQIFPRLKKLFGSRLRALPFFIVAVFNTVRIIPNGHPYLRPENHGRYSLFQALAAAADHITFERKNADKITFFVLILSGVALMLLQIILCLLALLAAPAYAYNGPGLGPRTVGAFFDNPNAANDIAFSILDLVFGVPASGGGAMFFGSSALTAPTPFHSGLHALFQFYSFGMVVVATFIILYLVVAMVLETADSGVPFGQRFNKAWAPVRVVLFFGLLLPTPSGINMAQYFLLEAARLGSNVATNAWLTFDRANAAPYVGTAQEMIARPNVPDLHSFVSFMALARTCSWAEGRINGYQIRPYIIYPDGAGTAVDIEGGPPAFNTVVQQSGGGNILIRFGHQDAQLYPQEKGNVFASCGEIALPIVDQGQPGSAIMQQAYLDLVSCLWNGTGGAALTCQNNGFSAHGRAYTARYATVLPYDPFPDMTPFVGDTQKLQEIMLATQALGTTVDNAVAEQIAQGVWTNAPALARGWAGAAIWFNKIAEQNGAVTVSVFAIPIIKKMPYVMEYIKQQKLEENQNVPLSSMFTPTLSSGEVIQFETPQQREIAIVLNQIHRYWGMEDSNAYFTNTPLSRNQETTGNIIIDVINTMMGTQGLFDMCRNTNIHPLAQLSSVGAGLVEHAIRGFGMAAGTGITGGILALLEKPGLSQTLMAATSFFLTFAGIGLILGFVLYYVLPFLPFIYFFFAVMTWVKGIFEAMVGMPLWALAHLRIDGEGMPGSAGTDGYLYILEIFLRPIFILISFLGGIIIFASMVKVLNQIFYLALSNLVGHNVETTGTNCFQPPGAGAGTAPGEEAYERGTVDEFFYTVMYAIIVYMIGLPCFKLVDIIPDNIMRWFGSNISTFGAQDGDPAAGMMSYVTAGSGLVGNKLKEGGASAISAFRAGS